MTVDPEIVYLDHAATTPVDPAVSESMRAILAAGGEFGNPASIHIAGRRAHTVIATARGEIATLLNTDPCNIIFTSGATEADNLAVIGAAHFRAHRGNHIVSMTTEHKAVLGALDALADQGFEVTRLSPDADGRLPLDDLAAALREDTQLVSVMHVNNETGVVQDIDAIGALCRERDVLFHCDAAQSAGKLELDLDRQPIDLMSLSAHKFHGPQGIGALFIADRAGCGVRPLLHGGSQERSLRPGTQPLALIAGFGTAARLARERMTGDIEHLRALNDRLWRGLERLPGLRRNGAAGACFPGILNVSADGVEGESLMLALEPLCVASGSACNSQSGEPSFVLKALGLTDREAQSAIRFSLGRDTRPADVDFAITRYAAAVTELRSISPSRELAA